jgi:hypothetical protein
MQNLNEPYYIKKIVEKCKKASEYEYDDHKYAEIITDSIIENAEDLLWVADEIHEQEADDYEGDWAEDFLDKYGVAFTIARLMNLSVTSFKPEEFNPEKLIMLLETHGPIALGMTTSTTLTMPENIFALDSISTKNKRVKNILSVDAYQDQGSHLVLIIGYNQKQVYFIDPNYPEFISRIRFDLFKKNMHLPEFVHANTNNIQPDHFINLTNKHDAMDKKRKVEINNILLEANIDNTDVKKRKLVSAIETNQQRPTANQSSLI